MLVLALDTTTRAGSCALMRDGRAVADRQGDPEVPAAERLPSDLMALLAAGGAALGDVDVFAVATGPGSFTSLRVGIATMQGLAFAEGKPLIGVSGLDALASVAVQSGGGSSQVATWVEAWRGDVYAALYENGEQIEAPVVAAPVRLLARLTNVPHDPNAAILFIGDGALAHRASIAAALGARARFPEQPAPPIATAVATLATRAARAGARPGPDEIRPLYVQRAAPAPTPDARPVS